MKLYHRTTAASAERIMFAGFDEYRDGVVLWNLPPDDRHGNTLLVVDVDIDPAPYEVGVYSGSIHKFLMPAHIANRYQISHATG